jgi:hypothetical protein
MATRPDVRANLLSWEHEWTCPDSLKNPTTASYQKTCPMSCMLHPPSNLGMPPVHRFDHATVGLSQPLEEALNESPLLISMRRASDQQLFDSLPTF